MNILIFGDSIAVGAFDTEKNGWVSRLVMDEYKKILSSKWESGQSIVNLSVSGHTSADVLERVKHDFTSRRSKKNPNISILAIGTNDAAKVSGVNQVSLEEFQTNIREIYDILQPQSERLIILGLPAVYEKLSSPWCFGKNADWKNTELAKYDAELQRFAKKRDLLFIPMQDVLDQDSDQHLPEGLHPNAEGHRLMYERVKSELEKENIL